MSNEPITQKLGKYAEDSTCERRVRAAAIAKYISSGFIGEMIALYPTVSLFMESLPG
jgi:hypothetical protein